ncbi:MAG TPA: biotin/lipoyl-binding protein [Edaphobacter sp.]|nr:biotin/lipoyl-binding protein [Edaphobacter sp.]
METATETANHKRTGRRVVLGVVIAAAIALLLVAYEVNRSPRTDDASVWANYIEIAPEVSGRLVELPVKDNAYVKKGDLLFVIDPRPYEYALSQALSDQQALEEQIIDLGRRIAAQNSAVQAAGAAVSTSKTNIRTASSNIEGARAAVTRAKAAAAAAEAKLKLDTNDLHRIEPLLQKQYVTVEQVDQANTAVRVSQGNYDAAQAAQAQAQAQLDEAMLHQEVAGSQAAESQAKLSQSIHAIDRIETLESQRPAKAAKVDSARLDVEWTRVVAPFDAYVTSMNISVGAYAHPGTLMFTLIDTRKWYVIANYRESKLKRIPIGASVDVYLMGHPDRRFKGRVESIGFGVLPEDGKLANGLPNIERTLNWVHLSARFPVRVLIEDPDPNLFRIGETAVTVVR